MKVFARFAPPSIIYLKKRCSPKEFKERNHRLLAMLLLLNRDTESFQVATVLSQFRLKLCNFDVFLYILL